MSEQVGGELRPKVDLVLSQAGQIIVSDQETFGRAGEFLKGVKALEKEVSSTFDPIIDQANKTHREALAQKKRFMEPLEQAENIVKRAVSVYFAAEEKKRLEIEAEAKKKLAEAAKIEDAGIALAEEAIAKGDQEGAMQAVETASVVSQGIVAQIALPPEKPKFNGIAGRKEWKFQILDKAKLPMEYLTPDMAAIGKTVRALGDKARIPGIRVWQETGISVRTS